MWGYLAESYLFFLANSLVYATFLRSYGLMSLGNPWLSSMQILQCFVVCVMNNVWIQPLKRMRMQIFTTSCKTSNDFLKWLLKGHAIFEALCWVWELSKYIFHLFFWRTTRNKKATVNTIIRKLKRKQIDVRLWPILLLKLYTSLSLRGPQVAR